MTFHQSVVGQGVRSADEDRRVGACAVDVPSRGAWREPGHDGRVLAAPRGRGPSRPPPCSARTGRHAQARRAVGGAAARSDPPPPGAHPGAPRPARQPARSAESPPHRPRHRVPTDRDQHSSAQRDSNSRAGRAAGSGAPRWRRTARARAPRPLRGHGRHRPGSRRFRAHLVRADRARIDLLPDAFNVASGERRRREVPGSTLPTSPVGTALRPGMAEVAAGDEQVPTSNDSNRHSLIDGRRPGLGLVPRASRSTWTSQSRAGDQATSSSSISRMDRRCVAASCRSRRTARSR